MCLKFDFFIKSASFKCVLQFVYVFYIGIIPFGLVLSNNKNYFLYSFSNNSNAL